MNVFDKPNVIEIQGNSITYYREGKGEVILFVHGITTYSFIWKRIIPFFSDKYDIILIDLLGCGNSDKPLTQDFSLKRQAHLIRDFAKSLIYRSYTWFAMMLVVVLGRYLLLIFPVYFTI
ncbi:MAG: alpha/beta fold hydrolase [Bacteroidetes bacterium]|nr:alpha/beta fold hydrolase [Bacteroidota bacterium]